MKQLNLFEDILPLPGSKKLTGPTTKEIEKKVATMGDPKSNGAWSRFVKANKEAEKKDTELKKMIKFGLRIALYPYQKPHKDRRNTRAILLVT